MGVNINRTQKSTNYTIRGDKNSSIECISVYTLSIIFSVTFVNF